MCEKVGEWKQNKNQIKSQGKTTQEKFHKKNVV